MTTPCDPMCPFLGCASCEYASGETPAAATVSARIGGTQTSGPGLHTETALVTPYQASEQEGLPDMVANSDPQHIDSRGFSGRDV